MWLASKAIGALTDDFLVRLASEAIGALADDFLVWPASEAIGALTDDLGSLGISVVVSICWGKNRNFA